MDIAWALRQYLSFMPEPAEVQFPSGQTIRVGGWSGFSRTWFARGQHCSLDICPSRCCVGHRISWFWFPEDPHPDGLPETIIRINGEPQVIYVHENVNPTRCDYLNPNGLGCSIWRKGQPVFCWVNPQMGLYPHGGRLWWFKRLPPRNWRWPQCPVDLAETRPDPAWDAKVLTAMIHPLRNIPGFDSRMLGLADLIRPLYDLSKFDELAQGRSLLPFETILEKGVIA